MSEMQQLPPVRNAFDIASRRSAEWSSLRFMVTRDHTAYLTVALVEKSRDGHPFLDSRIRGLQVLWQPGHASKDQRLWAIYQALLGVSQTGN